MGPAQDRELEAHRVALSLGVDDDDVVDPVLQHRLTVRAQGGEQRETREVASTAGRLLVAEPMLGDPNFDRTVVLMVEHTADGAMGLVLNRPTDLPVRDALPAWEGRVTAPAVLHVGGPVEERSGWCLARLAPGLAPPSFLPVLGDVGLLDLEIDPTDLAGLTAARLYAGYSGWGPGQLEHELAQDAWIVVDAMGDDPFLPNADELWNRILTRQGGHLARLSLFPRDPSLN